MGNSNMLTRVPKDTVLEVPPRYVNVSRLEDNESSGMEWHHIERIIKRHWKPSLAFLLGLELILLLVVLFLHTSYQSTATLEISPVVSENVGLHDTSPITPTQQDYLDTQSEILRSDYLAIKVIRDLNLDHNTTFYSPNLLARAINRVKVVWTGNSKEASDEEKTDGLVKTFRSGLNVAQVKNSRLVEVTFESRDARLSTSIVNDLVRLYLDDAHRSKYDSTLKAAESLAPELKDLKNSVDKSNEALSDFQTKHEGAQLAGTLQGGDATQDSMGQAISSNPVAVRVAQLNQQLTTSMADRMQQESNIRLIEENHYDVLPQMKDSPLIQELTQKRVDSRGQLAQALAVYGSNNPTVRKLQQQTDELNVQLNAERSRIVEQIKGSYKSAKVREDLLRKSLHDLKGQLDLSNADAVRFDLLRREAQAQSNLYIATSSRIKELAVSGSLAANNIRVLGDARIPFRPSGPHRFQILGAGLLLGMIGGVVLAFVSEGMDDKITTLADVERVSGMSPLGLLPASEKKWRGAIANGNRGILGRSQINGRSVPVLQFLKEKPNSPEAEAIRSLETAIRVSAQLKDTPVKTLLVTSGFPGEGKTTVATNLAAALSRHYKTCLIDADLRHPVITSTYGLKREIGLQDALMKPELVDELNTTPVEIPSLTVLGSGGAIPDAIDKMTSDSMARLLERLKTRFDYIVIDSPPVIPFAESRWLSALADGIVIVARASTTTRRALSWTMNILEDVQPQVLGVVLNGVDLSVDYDAYAKAYRYYRTIPA